MALTRSVAHLHDRLRGVAGLALGHVTDPVLVVVHVVRVGVVGSLVVKVIAATRPTNRAIYVRALIETVHI